MGERVEREAGLPDRGQHANPSVWEWVTAGLGAAVVIAVVGFIAYQAAVTRADPLPRISVSVDTVIGYEHGYIVELQAENSGGATAADVLVKGQLSRDTSVVEESEVSIDFLPPDSRRRAGLLFTRDPRAHRLAIRATGYGRP